MTYAIKRITRCRAWELGKGSEREQEMIRQGRIRVHPDGVYEIFSLEAHSGRGQIAKAGDYFKADFRGWPQPCERSWFLSNHSHVKDDLYEQIAKPLKIWRKGDPESEEIDFLLKKGILKIDPDNPECYFSAEMWDTVETAAYDAVIIFYDIDRDAEGKITDIFFNFVDAEYFKRNYIVKSASGTEE